MAVLETQEVARPRAEERAVFVTDDDRRARRLRRIALAITVVACLWLVALGLGVLGYGRMPGLPFGTSSGGSERSETPPAHASLVGAASVDRRLSAAAGAAAQGSRRASGARARAAGGTSAHVTAPPPAAALPAPPPAQIPVNPAGRERGWTRKGNPAPPGQARKTAEPKPPSRGQQKKEDPIAPPPVPPGQLKKDQPPPPPPP
jgi:hypothetical protein